MFISWVIGVIVVMLATTLILHYSYRRFRYKRYSKRRRREDRRHVEIDPKTKSLFIK